MASTFSYMFLSLFLFLYTSFSHATYPDNQLPLSAKSPKQQAERLIRALNLFPKHDINTFTGVDSLDDITAPKIVEKQIKFHLLGDPGPSVTEFGHYAGYYRLPNTKGTARMFYFFFESRINKKDPVVIWLTGGPGCASELALFYENGPFKLSENKSLVWNDYGWDKGSNIIFVDQPTGTGFSYSTSESDIPNDSQGAGNDLYNFLQEFFKGHPQFAKNDFYITGESYAGHYIPAFATRIQEGNNKKQGIHINLKGFAIGNGLTNPAIQYKAYPDFALENKLIDQSDYDRISQRTPDCEQSITACGNDGVSTCEDAYSICTQIFNDILAVAGNINYYDIRKNCDGDLCYDFSNMETFLNTQTIRDALGVGEIEFVSCSTDVHYAMTRDWMRNLEAGIPALLEDGLRVLIYAGEEDLICNWLGNSRWVNAMEWSGQKQFGAAMTTPFLVGGSQAGLLKSYGPLSFLQVHNAGHMVPMDQPQAALQMLQTWMLGKLAVNGTKDGFFPK